MVGIFLQAKNERIEPQEMERANQTNHDYDRNQKPFNDSGGTGNNLLGLELDRYLMLMHLSQFLGIVIPLLGLAAPIVLWTMNKDKYETVDEHGRIITNWVISVYVYTIIGFILTFFFVGVFVFIALGIMGVLFPIIGALRARDGEAWIYPMSFKFL